MVKRVAFGILTMLCFLLLVDSKSALGLEFSKRVRLTVTSDEVYQSQFQSMIARKLREIPGIVVTGDDPNYILDVIVAALGSNGFVAAVHFAVPFYPETFKIVGLGNKIDKKGWERARGGLENLEYPINTRVMASSEVESMCNMIIASFDTIVLESARKYQQQIEDASGKPRRGSN